MKKNMSFTNITKGEKTIDFGFKINGRGFMLRTFGNDDFAVFSEVLPNSYLSAPCRELSFYYPHLTQVIPGIIPYIEGDFKGRMKKKGTCYQWEKVF